MPHVLERATSGRAKCRACGRVIAKGELRFGERQASAFGEGETTLWFHPRCAAYTRPAEFLQAPPGELGDSAGELGAAAQFGIAHRRVPRIHGAERAPSGRAHCRSCRELIAKDTWRIPLVFFEEFRFTPGGSIHARCARAYFETDAILERIRHFNPELDAPALEALRAEILSAPPAREN